MARCPRCKRHFRTLEDEEGMHDCPHCGYGPQRDVKAPPPVFFSPGPWRVGNTHGAVVTDANHRSAWTDDANRLSYGGNMICESIRSVANARLIAAAPALFEALEMVRDADEDCHKDGLPTIPECARALIDRALAAVYQERQDEDGERLHLEISFWDEAEWDHLIRAVESGEIGADTTAS